MKTRCCGDRVEGGIYLCSLLGDEGISLSECLIDPPISTEHLNLSAQGMTPVTQDGVVHVLDRVGRENYANAADAYEEGCRLGFSRRIPKTFDFSLLTAASRLILVHDHALVENPGDLHPYRCPKGRHEHPDHLCVGACWQDIEGGTPSPREGDPWVVTRTLPSVSYHAWRAPEGVTVRHRQAMFLALPITQVEVIKGEGSEESLRRAALAALPVLEVDD